MPLTVVARLEEELSDLCGTDLALVRPDQIVASRRNGGLADADRFVAQLIGA